MSLFGKEEEHENVLVPQTEEEFDDLVIVIGNMTESENFEHVEAVLADRIQRMPPDQAFTTYDYLAQCVWKSRGYLLARARAQKIQSKMQVDEIAAHLKVDPNDQQAIDQLEQAAKAGNTYAQQVLDNCNKTEKVVSICQAQPVDTSEPTTG